jgi:hypothetical protein
MPDPEDRNPMKTTRITIKGSSGYCPVDVAFHDRISLTPNSIEYTYKPYYESEINRPQRWFYKTDSPMFSVLYHQVEVLLPRYLDSDEKLMCTDLGITEIIVTYEDKSCRSESWCCPSKWFSELFAVIKKMIPACEDVPEVLTANGDKKE